MHHLLDGFETRANHHTTTNRIIQAMNETIHEISWGLVKFGRNQAE